MPKHARVADIGTGNGLWLLDLAKSDQHAGWTLDGFDISSAHFPGQQQTPHNVTFNIADMKKGFEASFHHKFDLVHLRLVNIALNEDEWKTTLTSVRMLLKPDGWIQWDEADVRPAQLALRGDVSSKSDRLQLVMDSLFGAVYDRLMSASERQRTTFRGSGMHDVAFDVVGCDRIPANRAVATEVLLGVAHGIQKQRQRNGSLSSVSLAKFEELLYGATEEVKQGAYVDYHIQSARGIN